MNILETYTSHSPADTERIGEQVSHLLQPGDVLAFTGDLGAGKTAFVRGLARGLGLSDRVTSPTFAIVNEYREGPVPLFHFDMYRLGSSEELYDIGWEDYLRQNGVCAVEWSEIVEDALPADCLRVHIRYLDDTEREITISRSNS